MFAAAYETIVCDVPRPHVARITLNREKQMNAYNWRMTQELQAAVRNDSDPADQFLHMGSAYVRFGMDHPALYKLMFASEELPARHGEYPELQAAGAEKSAALAQDAPARDAGLLEGDPVE